MDVRGLECRAKDRSLLPSGSGNLRQGILQRSKLAEWRIDLGDGSLWLRSMPRCELEVTDRGGQGRESTCRERRGRGHLCYTVSLTEI